MNTKLIKKAKMAEKEMITVLLFQPSLSVRALQSVPVEDFNYYAEAYETITQAQIQNKNITSALLAKDISTAQFLDEYSLRSVEKIAEDIRECANARRLLSIGHGMVENIPLVDTYSFASQVQQDILKAVSDRSRPDSSVVHVVADFKKLRAERKENPHALLGESTGNKKLDEMTDGIRKGHLIVLGGYTSTGKTFASLNMAAEFVKNNKRVVYFSLEMAPTDILTRLLGILTKTSGWAIARGLGGNETEVDEKAEKLIEANFGIYTGIGELDEILFAMYEENLRKPVDLFVIDFIQLITKSKSKSEYETVTAAALELQLIAKKLNVPLIVLSQVSNESAKDKESDVMGFKGSGAIAAAADVAITLVKVKENSKEEAQEKKDKGLPIQVEWRVGKNRHGHSGRILMDFHGKTGVFELSEFEKV